MGTTVIFFLVSSTPQIHLIAGSYCRRSQFSTLVTPLAPQDVAVVTSVAGHFQEPGRRSRWARLPRGDAHRPYGARQSLLRGLLTGARWPAARVCGHRVPEHCGVAHEDEEHVVWGCPEWEPARAAWLHSAEADLPQLVLPERGGSMGVYPPPPPCSGGVGPFSYFPQGCMSGLRVVTGQRRCVCSACAE